MHARFSRLVRIPVIARVSAQKTAVIVPTTSTHDTHRRLQHAAANVAAKVIPDDKKANPTPKQIVNGLLRHITQVAADEKAIVDANTLYQSAIKRGSGHVSARLLTDGMMYLMAKCGTPNAGSASSPAYQVKDIPQHVKHLSTHFFTDPTVLENLQKCAVPVAGRLVINWARVWDFLKKHMQKSQEWQDATFQERMKGTIATVIEWGFMYRLCRTPAYGPQGIIPNLKHLIFGQKMNPFAEFAEIKNFRDAVLTPAEKTAMVDAVLDPAKRYAGP